MTNTPTIDSSKATEYIAKVWEDSIVPTLQRYIEIPNKSPMFDPKWRENGHMDKAVALVHAWCVEHAPADATVEIVRLEDRTPLIFIEVPGQSDDTVLLYGHLDKQPEMTGWNDDLGPWKPVLRDDKLYGRGGADDGYAAFASLTALNVLREQGVPHARCVIVIEACEESGSYDLPFYIDHLADRIGTPSLVICLDSGCGNYDQLWSTTSLRGIVVCNLEVSLLSEGVHSGDASGIVASSFRVMRTLLSRLEDANSGAILPTDLYVTIPRDRIEQASVVADVLGNEVWDKFPLRDGAGAIHADNTELVLNRTWRPALAITGASGMPELRDAGNVMRANTSVKLSLRLPPTLDADQAVDCLKELLLSDPPYGAQVTISHMDGASGWAAPPVAEWLDASLQSASETYFGKPTVYMGEGGSIPFMGMLGEKFPEAQFVITGVLGPYSNAHGPNEFLHLPTARKVTACMAHVLREHFVRS